MATMTESDMPQGLSPQGPALVRPEPQTRRGRRTFVLLVLALALVTLMVGGIRRLVWAQSHVSTDDAQVDGDILPVLPKVGGFVAAARVVENQRVHAGDTLVVLDDRDFRARLRQADADLAMALANAGSSQRVGQADAAVQQARAAAIKAHADLNRIAPLAAQGIASREQRDAAQAAVRSADAALAAAEAALRAADAHVAAARAARDQAALQLSYTAVLAPTTGVVSKKDVEVGQLVQPGQPLMSVVPLDDLWATANLKETQTAAVSPGEAVDLTVDSYPGKHFAGRVESLSPATGARFSLLPPDNATGNFTKVVQRVPVRIRLVQANDPTHPLRPGMSAVATITTN